MDERYNGCISSHCNVLPHVVTAFLIYLSSRDMEGRSSAIKMYLSIAIRVCDRAILLLVVTLSSVHPHSYVGTRVGGVAS